MTEGPIAGQRERRDLIDTLDKHRGFLLHTVQGIDDAAAGRRTTVSALCLGGIIKHVAAVEDRWRRFMIEGASAFEFSPEEMTSYDDGFRMLDGETLEGLVSGYQAVGAQTNQVIATVASLDDAHPLPKAPWFEAGASWSVRRVAVHILAETAQHAGHADIIREALDGARTMG